LTFYRVNAIKEFEYQGKIYKNGDLLDIPQMQYLDLKTQGKIDKVVQAFDRIEAEVATKKAIIETAAKGAIKGSK
jgi:hypothetical protein